MEEVKNINPDAKFQQDLKDASEEKEKRPSAPLVANKINEEAVKVDLAIKSRSSRSDERGKINSIIEQINLAVQATEEISALFESITGIVEQASQTSGSSDRLPTLELEAKELASAVRKITDRANSPQDTLPSDKQTLVAVEQKLCEALKGLFGSESGATIQPAEISFKSKDSITKTAQQVDQTRNHLESIAKNIRETAAEIRRAIELGEVALENGEASEVMVRDLEEAFKVAEVASGRISTNPEQAIRAIAIKKLRVDLLKL